MHIALVAPRPERAAAAAVMVHESRGLGTTLDEQARQNARIAASELDDVDPVGLHHAEPAQRGASIAELQAAIDNEFGEFMKVGKACDLRAVSSGQPAS